MVTSGVSGTGLSFPSAMSIFSRIFLIFTPREKEPLLTAEYAPVTNTEALAKFDCAAFPLLLAHELASRHAPSKCFGRTVTTRR